jgi:FMN phosphatase YigB (HAD superfamily)
MAKKSKFKLLVLDIDNTVFDWVYYYVNCLGAMLDKVSETTGIDALKLASECKEVFTKEGTIEYPFVVQQLPSVLDYYKGDTDKMLSEAVNDARDAFLETSQRYLIPYEGVVETLSKIRQDFPELKIAALTDAPRYVAMWKMNKLGVLDDFDAVYGLGDPRIPVSPCRTKAIVSEEILIKHLEGSQFDFSGSVRVLPDEYEKPGKRGLKTVLMDYDLDEDKSLWKQVLWVGDNVSKDVGLGNSMGITTAWAQYGTGLSKELLDKLKTFSPEINVRKNVSISTDLEGYKPHFELKNFCELVDIL